MNIASYGGGVNSTALLIGALEKGIKIDLILFADTGGERQETYDYTAMFSQWLVDHGMPPIQTVKKVDINGNIHTLEEYSLKSKTLPSLAYGFKSCSQKFKKQPQEKFVNNWEPAKAEWKAGRKIIKLIGYDADEERRAKIAEDDKYTYRYPLIEWQWGREECVEAIQRVGLPSPGKSSCFFCPASKVQEILSLPDDLKRRAIRIERNAELTSVKGLGRRFNWEELMQKREALPVLPADDIPCDCFDG